MRPSEEGAQRRERWEAHTRTPLMIGSAFFLVAYSWLVIVPQQAPAGQVVLVFVLGVVWVAFIVDLLVRIMLTPPGSRAKFVGTHLSDVASTLLPLLRPLQLLKYLPRIPWLKGSSGDSVRSRLVVVASVYVILFVYVIALGVLAVERDAPDATIVSFGDAIWWASVTVATVGYGDFSPVTVPGRVLAVALMGGGVAIIGTASATIVSYLSERIKRVHHHPADVDGDERGAGEV